jgi:hypothetical protein
MNPIHTYKNKYVNKKTDTVCISIKLQSHIIKYSSLPSTNQFLPGIQNQVLNQGAKHQLARRHQWHNPLVTPFLLHELRFLIAIKKDTIFPIITHIEKQI